MYGMFCDSHLDDELAMMTINMTSPTVLTKRFLPHIIERKGKIMNVASTAAFEPGPYMAVYYATKAYVLSFTEALASELEDTGVTVTALCPGPTRSGFQDKAAMNNSALVKGKKLPTADEVGQAGYRALMAGKRVFVPGFMNKLLVQTIRFLPRSMVTAIVKKMSRPVS
jgi:short-subunit dehydrogenase